VLELLARGLTNPEIAGVLAIARATVKAHVSAIIEALDVSNRTEAAVALRELGLSPGEEAPRPVPGFGLRPAIAVLPFDHFSGDAEQDVFADGLVEDLTTRLATVRWFPVIARNTAFAFRELPRDVREISRRLDARYLIEGSARRTGDRVRLHVQVIDGDSGRHVFAEKFDRALDDVFAVQDEIVDAIVGALEPALLRLEGMRALRRAPAELDTWERFQQAWALFDRSGTEGVDPALRAFEDVIARAPDFAPAHAALALASYVHGLFEVRQTQFGSTDPEGFANAFMRAGACFQRAADSGRRATELDERDPNAWVGLGAGLGMTGQLAPARAAFERAVELNPSSALACWSLATALQRFDDWEDAAPLYERAIRLSPHDTNLYAFEAGLASVHVRAGRYETALAWARRSVEHELAGGLSFRTLIPVCLSRLGRKDEARREVEAIRALRPDFNLKLAYLMAAPDVVEQTIEAFAEAGWDLRSAGAL
jgi:TolB-like protein/Tfp pilus assembly protein PilF